MRNDFCAVSITSGVLFKYKDESCSVSVFGIIPDDTFEFKSQGTAYGIVLQGVVTLTTNQKERVFYEGDYFSIMDSFLLESKGTCVIISQDGYRGMNTFGGPIEATGRLRYIDGCTDSLLIPPVLKGDPCINHLHFPKNITQTPHTHPSIRIGVVYKGNGVCLLENREEVELSYGKVFLLKKEVIHSFDTKDSTMDIVVLHPDSDFGPEHDEHPMINRTIVDGVSAKVKHGIRTKRLQ